MVTGNKEAAGDAPDISTTGSVTYMGSLMNVPQVLEQVAKMEVDRNLALQKVDVLEALLS